MNGELVLITGGAGFIGSNLAHRLMTRGKRVLLFDNLSRRSVERNVEWLRKLHGEKFELALGDVRDSAALGAAVARASLVYHLAAQVAVTTSVADPVADFEVNARGTLNLLEAIRQRRDRRIPLVLTSTNKVYGPLLDIELREAPSRYEPVDPELAAHGVSERRALDLYSPYGCSKGAADQYVLDYARIYDMPTVVLRMSCIYGPRQFGNEDQGWLAHFALRALRGEAITLYGDGKQVRDVLFVDDLLDALELCESRMDAVAGRAFNMGGGPANTVSLLELIQRLEELGGARPRLSFGAWRPGDQRYYVSDTRAFREATGWAPHVRAAEGIRRLFAWLAEAVVIRRFAADLRETSP